jgi:tetratricopeptide (TPR) repeat protein
VHVGLVGSTAILIRRRHWLGFALTFYLVHLLLVSNLLVDIGATMGERLVYHSSFGFALALAFVAQRRLGRVALVVLGTAVLVLGGYQTVRRNADWKNDDTLFLRDVTVVPNAALANGNAGRAHVVLAESAATPQERDQQLEQALRHLDRATELHPGFVNAHFYRVAAYAQLGRYDEMEASLRTARELFPGHPAFAEYDLVLASWFATRGREALQTGDAAAARPQLEKAVRYEPNMSEAWLLLGEACLELADTTCARASWERALEINPDLVQARTRLQSLPAASIAVDP